MRGCDKVKFIKRVVFSTRAFYVYQTVIQMIRIL